jgi:hypothetical protein
LPDASVAVAVAVTVEDPFAAIEVGVTRRLMDAASPVWTIVAYPETLGDTDASVAVIITGCTVFELVMVAV